MIYTNTHETTLYYDLKKSSVVYEVEMQRVVWMHDNDWPALRDTVSGHLNILSGS